MRKIRITESQLETILEYEGTYPLNVKGDDGRPDNFMGNEVAVDNTDDDATNDVTTTDNVSRKRSRRGWFGIFGYRSPNLHFSLRESENLDGRQNSGYGMKNDAFIQNMSNNGGGKMVNNLNNEIQSKTRGSKNNTNQKRIERLEDQKTEDPVTFAMNGGNKTLNILKHQVKKTSDSFSKDDSKTTIEPTDGGLSTSKKETKKQVYYFK